MNQTNLDSDVIKVKDFLVHPKLAIPIYQRPYKWNKSHVRQLIDDIKAFQKKPSYRFGTIVLHDNTDKGSLDIVDGQQRTLTLVLVIKALAAIYAEKTEQTSISEELQGIVIKLAIFKFQNPTTQQNIHRNYKEILRLVSDFDESLVRFLLHNCEFIVFKLKDVSEAFQFFDSQNARGKDLDPHDLLKAFHLRAFDTNDDINKFAIVDNWENANDDSLAKLFALYLYRIKGWAKGQSAREFSKDKIHLFKGVNINELNNYPYSKSLRILHHYIDEYNNSYYSRVNQHQIEYPFQLNEGIINGRRFFEMIQHYYTVFERNIKDIQYHEKLNDKSKEIIHVINTYNGRGRTGDGYTRLLLDTALIFYVDKFGEDAINSAVQFFFLWSYNLRLSYESLQLSSVDNYVLNQNVFKQINDAFTPKEVFNMNLQLVKDPKSTKTDEIISLFQSLNYL